MRQKYDKTEIIERGIQLFREKGYHHTGIDDILRTCEIPSGSFYNFFKSKEGFVIQALEHYNAQYLEYIQNALGNTKQSPLKRLKLVFQRNVKQHIDDDCSLGCLLNSMTSEVAPLNTSISEIAAEHYLKNSGAIANTIKEGQDLGEIRRDYSAQELAFFLIDGFSGATIRMKAGKTKQPLKLFLRTAFDFLES